MKSYNGKHDLKLQSTFSQNTKSGTYLVLILNPSINVILMNKRCIPSKERRRTAAHRTSLHCIETTVCPNFPKIVLLFCAWCCVCRK